MVVGSGAFGEWFVQKNRVLMKRLMPSHSLDPSTITAEKKHTYYYRYLSEYKNAAM
jgi:hypothetical protein